jgi:cell division protein FtsW (lipid II flippase)
MDEKVKAPEKAPACIPFFAHENSMMHYNRVNRRMMIIIITVCISFVITISVFVHNYTQREKEWIALFANITQGTEVHPDGLYEFPDAGTHP